MTKIIPTKFDNTKCRACGRHIAYGENVRWTKGEKGVTCVACPGHRVVNATTGEPIAIETAYESLARQLAAALSDGTALRAALGRAQAERDEMRIEIARLRSAMGHELHLAVQRGLDKLSAAPDVEIHNEESGSIEDGDCPI